MKKQILFFASTLTVLLIVACKHHPDINGNLLDDNGGNGGNDNPPDTIVIINTDPCDPDTVYFQNTILPLLQMSCAIPDQPGDGCHDAVDHAEGVRLYDYAHIMNEVVPGNLNASELWDALHENGDDMMPPADYGGPFSPADMAAIQTWIMQGALNNGCTEDCDPTQGSFAQNVLPIVEQTCQGGCHAGANPSASLSLETYAEISASALDGSLMSSLLATNGYSIMPDNTTGLPECYITQIQNWIDAGAPNN